jgi:Iodothyronine deiodinase
LHQRYKDRVQFLAIYVREAHPTDGWRVPSNDKVGISILQPKTQKERTKVADQCCATLEITMPLLVDGLDDRVGHAYSGMPDRMYVIDRLGKVVYQGGRGPFGFKPGEMEQSLAMMLLEDAAAPATSSKREK